MRIARCGHGPLPASFARGIFRGHQPQELHECSGSIEARQVSECGSRGDGHKALPPPQGLKGFDYGVEAPRFDLCLECLLQTLKSLHVFVDRAHVFLENDVLRRCGTDHFREPSERGRVPGGPAGVAAIVPQQKGCAPQFRRLEIADGIFPRPAEVADGCILHHGDIHRRESPARASLANCTASRRSVLTRSPACLGISDGATTQQSSSFFVRYR